MIAGKSQPQNGHGNNFSVAPWEATVTPLQQNLCNSVVTHEGFSSELPFPHPLGALAGVHRACAQWAWHAPPTAKHTGPGEREGMNGKGRRARRGGRVAGKVAKWLEAEWATSAPDSSSHILASVPTRCMDTRGAQKPFAPASPRTRQRSVRS